MKEFKRLDFPRLREYYTKYPQGYTLYESLLDILEHINEMTGVVNLTLNQWEQIETWVLNELKNYSIDQLQTWLDDGTLEQVINQALLDLDDRLSQTPTLSELSEEVEIPQKVSQYTLYNNALKKQKENELNNIIRVSTFNIYSLKFDYFDVLNRIKNEILKSLSHVCCMQEMIDGVYLSFDRDLTSRVYPHPFFYTTADSYDFHVGNRFGNASISSLPMIGKTGSLYDMGDISNSQTSYQRFIVNFQDVNIAIYNTHLTSNSLEQRQSELQELFNVVNNDPVTHTIVCGDFNEHVLSFFQNFTNSGYTIVNTGQYKTAGGYGIDNILVSSGLEVVSSNMQVISPELSDHHLLYADIKVK